MNFIKLKNPKTDLYLDFKNQILSAEFDWVYSYTIDKDPFGRSLINTYGDEYGQCAMYSHPLLDRPDHNRLYPQPVSPHLDKFNFILLEIFNHNKVKLEDFYVMLRANVNAVNPPIGKVKYCLPHYDHPFPHKNMIIYLTDAGGKTICEEEFHDPAEDDVLLMEGRHHLELPKEKRRVVLVATYV